MNLRQGLVELSSKPLHDPSPPHTHTLLSLPNVSTLGLTSISRQGSRDGRIILTVAHTARLGVKSLSSVPSSQACLRLSMQKLWDLRRSLSSGRAVEALSLDSCNLFYWWRNLRRFAVLEANTGCCLRGENACRSCRC